MNGRRLLAFDLDRTLLTEDSLLPLPIERAIKAARREGHLVTVLTGRPLAATQPFLEQLEIDGHFSVNHGGAVYGSGGKVLRQLRLSPEIVTGLIEPYWEVADLDFSCILDDVLYVRDPEDDRWAWAHTRNRVLQRYQPGSDLPADKIVFAADDRTTVVEREIAARYPDLITYLWGDGFLEITGPQADKGSALEFICGVLDVPREATVAFGDGLNDVTMLAWAGHGVAVGPTAHADALAQAKEHIPPPEEGGVAQWISENLGINLEALPQATPAD